MVTARNNLVADPSHTQTWLAHILRKRLDKILELYTSPGGSARDENVHDMRVSIRKLRGALRDFAHVTDTSELRKIKKKLKRLADLLGHVRDLDVAIDAFTRASASAKSDEVREGIGEIVEDCKAGWRAAFDRLEKHFAAEDLVGITKQFDNAFDHSLGHHDLFARTTLAEIARDVIENRLDSFLKKIDVIYDPFAVRRIHRLRILGKHLRYSIELFEEPFSELGPFADEIKRLQSYLGDLHDRDFWIKGLIKRISTTAPRTEREEIIYRARIWLLSEFTRQRMDAYRGALQTWSEWRETDLPGRLRNVLVTAPQ